MVGIITQSIPIDHFVKVIEMLEPFRDVVFYDKMVEYLANSRKCNVLTYQQAVDAGKVLPLPEELSMHAEYIRGATGGHSNFSAWLMKMDDGSVLAVTPKDISSKAKAENNFQVYENITASIPDGVRSAIYVHIGANHYCGTDYGLKFIHHAD